MHLPSAKTPVVIMHKTIAQQDDSAKRYAPDNRYRYSESVSKRGIASIKGMAASEQLMANANAKAESMPSEHNGRKTCRTAKKECSDSKNAQSAMLSLIFSACEDTCRYAKGHSRAVCAATNTMGFDAGRMHIKQKDITMGETASGSIAITRKNIPLYLNRIIRANIVPNAVDNKAVNEAITTVLISA